MKIKERLKRARIRKERALAKIREFEELEIVEREEAKTNRLKREVFERARNRERYESAY